MRGSVPSLEEIKKGMITFFIFSLFAIAFWTWFFYNISTIIGIFKKNIWITILFLIAFWIIPPIFVYLFAKDSSKNISFSKSFVASLISNIIYILISLIIFASSPYMNQIDQISVISILIILFIFLLISYTIFYAKYLNVNLTDAFKIVSIYAFILTIMMIFLIYFIIYNNL
ncbi:MAG: hypothetical protein ACO2OX_03965 [Candidatus Nanopusillus sp.]